ncbi:hypothetical protein [Microbulbifer sp. JMSA008]|uniref:hypothetical protein n=1 Tax=Microbulbifer sp. JMSA008 TaxID=3243373 RepID=UPI0040399C00
MKSVLTIFFAFLLASCATQNTENADIFDFKFGLLVGGSMNTLDVVENQFIIPHRVATKLPYFGFKINSGHYELYSVQTIIYFPSAPKSISGNLEGSPEDYAEGIKSRVNLYQGRSVVGYRLEPGDPYGDYKLVVLVNGRPWQEVDYKIVPESA